MLWLLFILLVVDAFVLYKTSEPRNLRIVKDKYDTLVRYIETHLDTVPAKFHVLKDKRVIISGVRLAVGYNISKGDEIGLCLDGEPNDVFHVFIHELAHMTVPEYDHSDQFWQNFEELKEFCTSIGLYQKILEPKTICGQPISD